MQPPHSRNESAFHFHPPENPTSPQLPPPNPQFSAAFLMRAIGQHVYWTEVSDNKKNYNLDAPNSGDAAPQATSSASCVDLPVSFNSTNPLNKEPLSPNGAAAVQSNSHIVSMEGAMQQQQQPATAAGSFKQPVGGYPNSYGRQPVSGYDAGSAADQGWDSGNQAVSIGFIAPAAAPASSTLAGAPAAAAVPIAARPAAVGQVGSTGDLPAGTPDDAAAAEVRMRAAALRSSNPPGGIVAGQQGPEVGKVVESAQLLDADATGYFTRSDAASC